MRKINNRNIYVDMVRGFAVLLVIIHHSPIPSAILRAAILAFHMPLFFAITGLYITPIESTNQFCKTIKEDAKRILIPYIVFELFYFAVDPILYPAKVGGGDWERILSIIEVRQGRLWFLPCLLVSKLFFYSVSLVLEKQKILKESKEQYKLIFILLLFVCLSYIQNILFETRWPFTLAHALMATSFIAYGKLISTYVFNLPKKSFSYKCFVCIGGLVLCAITSAMNGFMYNGACLFYINEYGNYFLMYLAATGGIIASFAFISILFDGDKVHNNFSKVKIDRFLLFLGVNGVLTFVVNEQVMGITRKLYEVIGLTYNWPLFVLTVMICIVSVFFLSLPINRYLPIIVGKKQRK